MRQKTREFALGLFLLLLGAAVLLASPVLVGEAPSKWEIIAGVGVVGFGAWLVSPDPVGKRLHEIARRVPLLHDHEGEDTNS